MKNTLMGFAILFSISATASSGNSFTFDIGSHTGVTEGGRSCVLIITDKVGDCSACKYKITYKENGKNKYNYFSTLKQNYAIDNSIGSDAIYINKQVSMRFGGYYNDELVLHFNSANEITKVFVNKEARVFSGDKSYSCELKTPFEYSI